LLRHIRFPHHGRLRWRLCRHGQRPVRLPAGSNSAVPGGSKPRRPLAAMPPSASRRDPVRTDARRRRSGPRCWGTCPTRGTN